MKQKHNLLEERQCFKPMNYEWSFNSWLAHEQSHWIHSEIKLGKGLEKELNSS